VTTALLRRRLDQALAQVGLPVHAADLDAAAERKMIEEALKLRWLTNDELIAFEAELRDGDEGDEAVWDEITTVYSGLGRRRRERGEPPKD
jgi:hypothetical protein